MRVFEGHAIDAFPVAALVYQASTKTNSKRKFGVLVDSFLRIRVGQVIGIERDIELVAPFIPYGLQMTGGLLKPIRGTFGANTCKRQAKQQ